MLVFFSIFTERLRCTASDSSAHVARHSCPFFACDTAEGRSPRLVTSIHISTYQEYILHAVVWAESKLLLSESTQVLKPHMMLTISPHLRFCPHAAVFESSSARQPCYVTSLPSMGIVRPQLSRPQKSLASRFGILQV